MSNLAARLEAIRTHRSRVDVMYQAVAAPTKLQGKVSGSMAIKLMYEQVGREEYARRFKNVLDDLDRQEQDVLAKMGA